MKIVAISDTHYKHLEVRVPDGDVLVVAGDFMHRGDIEDIPPFREWLIAMPHDKIIVIAGNHDWAFENDPSRSKHLLCSSFSRRVTYLQDEAYTYEGVKFYGTPWQPDFFNWAFNLPRGEELKAKWDLIPDDTNVLITHGPPAGIMDSNMHDPRFGCEELLKRVMEIKPDVHIFGHAHAAHGYVARDGIKFYNVAVCDEAYNPVHFPTVIWA